MPFSPSDLLWWQWLLCSLGAWIVCVIASAVIEKKGCLHDPLLLSWQGFHWMCNWIT